MTNTAKRLVFAILAVAMMITMVTAVSAAGSATLKISDTVLEGDNFTFRVTLDDVSDSNGAAGFEFKVIYDKNVFEFVSATPTFPDDWETNNSSAYEDLSTLIENGKYLCAHISIAPGHGAESGEIYIDFTFKVNGEANGKTIKLSEISIASDTLEELYKGGDLSFKVVTANSPDVSNEPVSNDISDESTNDISDPENSEDSSSDVSEPQNSDESTESTESTEPDTSSNEPSNSESSVPESSVPSADDDSTSSGIPTWLFVVIIAAVVIVVGLVILIIIKRKNRY